MKTKIKCLKDIDYKDDAEGTLLFTALSILTTTVYRDKTPDEVVEILNEKSKWWEEEKKLATENPDGHAARAERERKY